MKVGRWVLALAVAIALWPVLPTRAQSRGDVDAAFRQYQALNQQGDSAAASTVVLGCARPNVNRGGGTGILSFSGRVRLFLIGPKSEREPTGREIQPATP